MHIVASKKFPNVVIHASNDVFAEALGIIREGFSLEGSTLEEIFDGQYEEIFFQRVGTSFQEFIRRHGALRQCSQILVLNAHGGAVNGEWTYEDRLRSYSLQTWVDRHAKNAAAIVLMVCNEHGMTVTSKHTPVFIPDRVIGKGLAFELEHLSFHYTMRMPDGEEVDAYTIDYHLRKLPQPIPQ
jgi:hypothetical protein